MSIEFIDVVREGKATISLNVNDPSAGGGVAAGIGGIGIALDGTLWYKRGPNSVDWEIIAVSEEDISEVGRTGEYSDLLNRDVVGDIGNNSILFQKLVIPSPVTLSSNTVNWGLPRSTFVVNLSANVEFNFDQVVPGKTISIVIKSSGNYTVTWPSEIKWPDEEAPEQTESGIDVYTFIAVSASEIYGAVSSNHA